MSKLKFENNFTTYEQSNELLKLGVPADTADCILIRFMIAITIIMRMFVNLNLVIQ